MNLLKQPLFVFLFWLLLLISVLHHLAIFLYFYWTIFWFDMVMHFLGGMSMATAVLWIVFWSGIFKKKEFLPLKKAFLVALLSSLVIGVLWEIFEVVGQIISWPSDRFDSMSDLMLDMLGGIAAFFNSLRFRNSLKKIDEN